MIDGGSEMKQNYGLEKQLRRKIHRTRWILAAISLFFFVLLVVFAVMREKTKTVHTVFNYTSVSYDSDYSLLAGLCFVVFFMVSLVFLLTFIFAKVTSVEVGGSSVLLYRGPASVVLYIDGREASRSGYYLEGCLANGAIATVALSRNTLYAHMTFSDGHPPIDL